MWTKPLKCPADVRTEVSHFTLPDPRSDVLITLRWAHPLTPICTEKKRDRNFISILFVNPELRGAFGLAALNK
jgi:hypothetical protein